MARRCRCSSFLRLEESFAFFTRSSEFVASMFLDNHVSMCLGVILLHADLLWLVPDQSCGGHMHACVLALVCASAGAIQGHPGWSTTLQIPRCIVLHTLPSTHLASEELLVCPGLDLDVEKIGIRWGEKKIC